MEESSVSESDDSSSDDSSSNCSSTEEKMKKIAKMDAKKDPSDPNMNNDTIEEMVGNEDSDVSDDAKSEQSDLNKIDEMGLDRNYLMKELGCDSKKVLMDEDLLDQFIVLKAIIDKNLPKLLFRDISIL